MSLAGAKGFASNQTVQPLKNFQKSLPKFPSSLYITSMEHCKNCGNPVEYNQRLNVVIHISLKDANKCPRGESEDYVNFGEVARRQCNQQCQYASREVDLYSDLRVRGDKSDYHGMTIHNDDVATFVRRYKEKYPNQG